MICQRCGAHNDRITYEPVFPKMIATMSNENMQAPAQPVVAYKRWACWKCHRYHFADGTLYTNPFREEDP